MKIGRRKRGPISKKVKVLGMALQKWSSDKNHSKRELVWKLADRVDVRIRDLYERWEKIMLE
jgi:hypothetical protein